MTSDKYVFGLFFTNGWLSIHTHGSELGRGHTGPIRTAVKATGGFAGGIAEISATHN